MSTIYLAGLTLSQGFSITGANEGDISGLSVKGAGDVNGDGIDDFIIGAPCASNVGVSYVLFGQKNFTSININLDVFSNGATSQGFSITGTIDAGSSGYSVSGAGDYNNDGYADVIIYALGNSYASPAQVSVGYVIFGSTSTSAINLASLSFQQGFSITTTTPCNYNSLSGGSASGAGDVNGDGYADVIIGNPCVSPSSYSIQTGTISYSNAGTSYVIFGNATNFLTNINLASITQNGWIYREL